MKIAITISISLAALCALGQGTFVVDQQAPAVGDGPSMQSLTAPWGQSFTPAFSSTDFIRLVFLDGNPNDGLGATVHLTLHSDSINGPTIGTTESETMANRFAGPADFLFPSSVPLTPGVTYYFQPTLQDGGTWSIEDGPYSYSGGDAYNAGVAEQGINLWFREGIIVPEPSSAALLALGGLLFLHRHKKS